MLAAPLLRSALCAPVELVTVASPGGSEKETGTPSKAGATLAALTAPPLESVSSEPVRVDVRLGPVTWAGLAVAESTSRGAAVMPVPEVVSQPDEFGPVLQPHQSCVASTLPVPLLVMMPPVPLLPTNR